MNDKTKLSICITALKMMGKLLRDNPPPFECGLPFEEYIVLIVGGLQ